MEEIISLLRQSVALYQNLLEQTSTLPKLLRHLSPDDVEAYITQYRNTLEDTRAVDTTLLANIEASGADIQTNSLFLERRHLMETLAENNVDLFSLLSGKLAVINSEISQVRQGRNVTAGYRTGGANRNGSRLKVSG